MASPPTTRRDVLRKVGLAGSLVAIPGIAGTLVDRAEACPAVCEAPDPILALIAQHNELRRIANEFPEDDGEQYDAACMEEMACLHDIVRTVPTTSAGMLAYLDHIQSPAGFGCTMADCEDVAAICHVVRQFVSGRGQ